MALRDKEAIAEKLNGYADKLTGFSILQSISFVFAFENQDFRKGVELWGYSRAFFLIMAILAVYATALVLCLIGEDKLVGEPNPSTPEGKWIWYIRLGRFAVVFLSNFINAYTLGMFH